MFNLETFLNLPHFNYSQALLLQVSQNTNVNQEKQQTQQQATFVLSQNETTIPHGLHSAPSFDYISAMISNNSNTDIYLTTRNEIYRNNSIEHKFTIHKPYVFQANTELLHLSRNVLNPSLCLFEKVVGWKIKIITESEM